MKRIFYTALVFLLLVNGLQAEEDYVLVLTGHTGNCVDSATFSPDGKKLVSASDDKTARIWDVESGKELLKLE